MDENFASANPLFNQTEENITQNTNINIEEIPKVNQPKIKRRKKRNISKTFLFYSPTSFYYQIIEMDQYKFRGIHSKGKGFSIKNKDKQQEEKKETTKEENKDEIKEDKNEKTDEEDNKDVQDNKKKEQKEVKDDDKIDIKEDNKNEEHVQNDVILNQKESQNNVLQQQENPIEQQVNDLNKENEDNTVKDNLIDNSHKENIYEQNQIINENIPQKEEQLIKQEHVNIDPQEKDVSQKEDIKYEEQIVNPSHEEVIPNKNNSEIKQVQDNDNNDNDNSQKENVPSNNIEIIENQDDEIKQEPIIEPFNEQFIPNNQEESIQETNIVNEIPENEVPEQQEIKQNNKHEPSSSESNQSKPKIDRARLLAFRKRANLDKVKLKAVPQGGENEHTHGPSFFDNIHMKSIPKDNSDPNQPQQSNFFDNIQMKAVPKNEETNANKQRSGSFFDTIHMKAVPKSEENNQNKERSGSFFDTVHMKAVPKNEEIDRNKPRTGSVFETVHMKAVPQMEVERSAMRKKSIREQIKMKEVPKTQFEVPKLKSVEKSEVKIELDKMYSYEKVFQTDKNDHVWSICFCPTLLEGKPAIVTGHASGMVYAWDMEKFAKTKTYKEHTSKVYDIKKIFITSAFRQIFVTVSEDHMLKIWESSSQRSTISITAPNPLYTLDIHPSNYIIYGDKEKYLYCQYIDIGGKGQLIKDQNFKSETTHNSYIWRVKVLGKGSLENTYVVSTSESSLQIHKLEIKRRKFNLYKEFPEAHNGLIHDIIEIGRDTNGFMTCGIDHCIKLWNVHEDAPLKSIDYLYDDVILSLMELSDENAVVCGGYDKKLKVISKDRLLKEGDDKIKENCEYVRNESMYKLIPIVNDSVFTVASINYGCSENVYLWGSAINYRQKEKEKEDKEKKNENKN